MGLTIISAGLLTTIQDLGRYGYQKAGMVVSGAMDAYALRVANLLVGNPEGEAGIEASFLGPKIRFEEDCLLAITGGELSPTLNGERVKGWRPVFAPKGSLLEFGAAGLGSWAYLAVSGGFAIPPVLGSYATYIRAEVGGLHGKSLRPGDYIPAKGPTPTGKKIIKALTATQSKFVRLQATWSPNPELYPPLRPEPVIRAMKGPEFNLFTTGSQADFWHNAFLVTSDSDRMGYRLQGAALAFRQEPDLISSAVTFGTIQVPAHGHPIALLADHQTTGGYARIAQVITADFSKLAQVPFGKKIRFQEVTLAEAQHQYLQQERNIARIKRGIQLKISST
jgi:antagonist of KipI